MKNIIITLIALIALLLGGCPLSPGDIIDIIDDTGQGMIDCDSVRSVTRGNGRIWTPNLLTVELSEDSPGGPATPGYMEVLRFNINSTYAHCGDEHLETLTFWIDREFPDSWITGKSLEVYVDGMATPSFEGIVRGTHYTSYIHGDFTILAGETVDVSVWTDTSSAEEGDTLTVSLDWMYFASSYYEELYWPSGTLHGNELEF